MSHKDELLAQLEEMSEEEAAQVRLVFAPEWPSKATSIGEIRRRLGTEGMSAEESAEFWREHGPLIQAADG
jgi:hypothetical protein